MNARAATATLGLTLIIGAGHATAVHAADPTLNPGIEKALPSIVLVEQETTGTLVDADGTAHGPYDLLYAGTGFFISSDGYIVTAAHVAAPTTDELHLELANAYVDEKYNCNPYSAADQCDGVESSHAPGVVASTTVKASTVQLRVLTQDMDPNADGLNATLAASSPSSALDTAVIKIAGKNEPVSLLAGDTSAATGDPIAVIGYPASAQNGSKGPTMVPTTTTGQITDLLPPDPTSSNAASANLVRVDAHVEHGNSGGPAVDGNGNVIGIVSFGNLHTVNYLISVADVRSVVRQSAADNALGTIDNLWRDGLTAADAGKASVATNDFKQCHDLNAVQIYCDAHAHSQLAAGEPGGSGPPGLGSTTTPRSNLVSSDTTSATAALTLLAIILATIFLGVIVARRRASQPVPAWSGYYQWPAQGPYYPATSGQPPQGWPPPQTAVPPPWPGYVAPPMQAPGPPGAPGQWAGYAPPPPQPPPPPGVYAPPANPQSAAYPPAVIPGFYPAHHRPVWPPAPPQPPAPPAPSPPPGDNPGT